MAGDIRSCTANLSVRRPGSRSIDGLAWRQDDFSAGTLAGVEAHDELRTLWGAWKERERLP